MRSVEHTTAVMLRCCCSRLKSPQTGKKKDSRPVKANTVHYPCACTRLSRRGLRLTAESCRFRGAVEIFAVEPAFPVTFSTSLKDERTCEHAPGDGKSNPGGTEFHFRFLSFAVPKARARPGDSKDRWVTPSDRTDSSEVS